MCRQTQSCGIQVQAGLATSGARRSRDVSWPLVEKPGLMITQAPFWETPASWGEAAMSPESRTGRLAMPQTRRLPLRPQLLDKQIGFFHRETRVVPRVQCLEVAVCEELETPAQPLRMRALWGGRGRAPALWGLWKVCSQPLGVQCAGSLPLGPQLWWQVGRRDGAPGSVASCCALGW